MRAIFGIGAAAALALLAAGCGGKDSGNASQASNAPLKQIAAPGGSDWTQTVSQTAEGGFRMGNPSAPVKLVEYASISCPFCARFTGDAAESLTSKYVKSGQVSWEYRPFLIHATDPGVFMLLACQGAEPFFPLSEQLYATQAQWAGKAESLPPEQVRQIDALPAQQKAATLVQVMGVDQFFRERGMPSARIQTCLADSGGLDKLAQSTQRGTQEGVTGTPTFFINGKQQEGVDSWQKLEGQLRNAIG